MWIVFVIFLFAMFIPTMLLCLTINLINHKQKKYNMEENEIKIMTEDLLRSIDVIYHYEVLKFYIMM